MKKKEAEEKEKEETGGEGMKGGRDICHCHGCS